MLSVLRAWGPALGQDHGTGGEGECRDGYLTAGRAVIGEDVLMYLYIRSRYSFWQNYIWLRSSVES